MRARARGRGRRRCAGALLVAVVCAGCTGGGGSAPPSSAPSSAAPSSSPSSAAPSSSPSSSPPVADPPRSVSLVATGDVLLHPPLWEQARRDAAAAGAGALDFAPQLAAVQPLVAAADLGVCHLETPLAPPEGPFRGYPAFAAPPQVVPALAQTGYDACTTASNHSFDAGAEGVTRTLDALDAAGLASAGTARTPEEAERPTVLDVPGPAGAVRVALVSGTYGFNGVPAPGGQEWRGDALEEEALLREAAAARAAGAEVVVLALHWGEEYEQEPSAQQLQLAPRLLASPDVDLLLGHHAHVVQPVEQVGGEWVAYGLGNLLAAHSTQGEPLREGLAVRFVLTEQPDGRFATTQAGYAPLLVTDAPPHRVLDVAAALRAGGAPGASPERLAQAWERTTAVVGARGAAGAGLVPLSTP